MKKILSIAIAAVMTASMAVTAFAATTTTESTTSNTPTVSSSEQTSIKTERSGKGAKQGKGARVNVISVAAGVLGMTEEEVRESVKTDKVGTLLINAGKVAEFKKAYLSECKAKLDMAVAGGTTTQADADTKYTEAEAKIESYDGTTHLCGGTDHSKIFEKKSSSTSSTNAS